MHKLTMDKDWLDIVVTWLATSVVIAFGVILCYVVMSQAGCLGTFAADPHPVPHVKQEYPACAETIDLYNHVWYRELFSGADDNIEFFRDNTLCQYTTWGDDTLTFQVAKWYFTDSAYCNRFIREDHYHLHQREYHMTVGISTLLIQWEELAGVKDLVYKKRK